MLLKETVSFYLNHDKELSSLKKNVPARIKVSNDFFLKH